MKSWDDVKKSPNPVIAGVDLSAAGWCDRWLDYERSDSMECNGECDNLRDKLRNKTAFCRECGDDAIKEIEKATAVKKQTLESLKVIRDEWDDVLSMATSCGWDKKQMTDWLVKKALRNGNYVAELMRSIAG